VSGGCRSAPTRWPRATSRVQPARASAAPAASGSRRSRSSSTPTSTRARRAGATSRCSSSPARRAPGARSASAPVRGLGLRATDAEATVIASARRCPAALLGTSCARRTVPIVSDDRLRAVLDLVARSADAGWRRGNLEGAEDSCQGDSGGPLMVPS
jgi:hypothetical protein